MNPLKVALQQRSIYRVLIRGRALTNWSERALRKATGGRIGVLDLVGLPSIQLTVAGRDTGILHTTTLQYVPDGDVMLVVASNWGSKRQPSWSANLMVAKQVIVRRRADQFTASVRMLTGVERTLAWNKILRFWPNYQIAQEMAGGREFRIFAIER
jgi:deazaflavin-dependent oxidoreductase (nitroreductase family)